MASFAMRICKLDEMELQNAINQTEKIISGRFDFKGSEAKAEWKQKENSIEIRAEDDTKVKAVLEILRTNMLKRGIGLKGMEESDITATGMKMKKMTLKLSSGIDKDSQKAISKVIKESGFKGKAQYMDEKYRLESKSIDELQAVFRLLRESKEVKIDLQMENMKR
jgi:uncharacterized protein YajQ (UPF0234 family)